MCQEEEEEKSEDENANYEEENNKSAIYFFFRETDNETQKSFHTRLWVTRIFILILGFPCDFGQNRVSKSTYHG